MVRKFFSIKAETGKTSEGDEWRVGWKLKKPKRGDVKVTMSLGFGEAQPNAVVAAGVALYVRVGAQLHAVVLGDRRVAVGVAHWGMATEGRPAHPWHPGHNHGGGHGEGGHGHTELNGSQDEDPCWQKKQQYEVAATTPKLVAHVPMTLVLQRVRGVLTLSVDGVTCKWQRRLTGAINEARPPRLTALLAKSMYVWRRHKALHTACARSEPTQRPPAEPCAPGAWRWRCSCRWGCSCRLIMRPRRARSGFTRSTSRAECLQEYAPGRGGGSRWRRPWSPHTYEYSCSVCARFVRS